MRSAREKAGKWWKSVVGAGGGTVAGSNVSAASKAYAVAVFAAVILSLAVYIVLKPDDGLLALAVIWGLFLGITFLFWMPGRMLVVMFGALLGSGASDWATANGFITATNAGVREAYIAMTGTADGFSTAPVWVFVLLVLICCVPALFEKGEVALPAP